MRHPTPAPANTTETRPLHLSGHNAIEQMSLDQFSTAGLMVRVYSKVLGEEVILASDNARLPESLGLPVYRAFDLSQLLQLRSPDLPALHACKKASIAA